jgi:hypothetical protein
MPESLVSEPSGNGLPTAGIADYSDRPLRLTTDPREKFEFGGTRLA